LLALCIRDKILIAQLAGQARSQLAIIEWVIKPVPGRLGVGHVYAPFDACLSLGDLADDPVVVVKSVNPEALDLLLDELRPVLEAAFRLRWQAGDLRSQEPLGTATDPADTNGGINAQPCDLGIRRRDRGCRRFGEVRSCDGGTGQHGKTECKGPCPSQEIASANRRI